MLFKSAHSWKNEKCSLGYPQGPLLPQNYVNNWKFSKKSHVKELYVIMLHKEGEMEKFRVLDYLKVSMYLNCVALEYLSMLAKKWRHLMQGFLTQLFNFPGSAIYNLLTQMMYWHEYFTSGVNHRDIFWHVTTILFITMFIDYLR